MRPLLFPAVLLSLATSLAAAQPTAWTPDPAHSEVDFSIRHMGLTFVHGRFGKVTGTIHYDPADLGKSVVQVSIDLTGVDTGVAARDSDLKSPHFFDVAQYPSANFTSTSVARSGSGLTVSGNLTLHGVTRPVVLQVDAPVGPIDGMGHKKHMGYSATAILHRTDFAIGPKYPASMIGDDVNLTIELDAVQQ